MFPARPEASKIALRVVVAVALVLVGIWLGGHPSWLPSPIRNTFVSDSGGRLVDQVLSTINRDYYRRVDSSQLVDKGLVGMVASLNDPYSHYYDPADYRSFLNETNPHLSGIGVDVLPTPPA